MPVKLSGLMHDAVTLVAALEEFSVQMWMWASEGGVDMLSSNTRELISVLPELLGHSDGLVAARAGTVVENFFHIAAAANDHSLERRIYQAVLMHKATIPALLVRLQGVDVGKEEQKNCAETAIKILERLKPTQLGSSKAASSFDKVLALESVVNFLVEHSQHFPGDVLGSGLSVVRIVGRPEDPKAAATMGNIMSKLIQLIEKHKTVSTEEKVLETLDVFVSNLPGSYAAIVFHEFDRSGIVRGCLLKYLTQGEGTGKSIVISILKHLITSDRMLALKLEEEEKIVNIMGSLLTHDHSLESLKRTVAFTEAFITLCLKEPSSSAAASSHEGLPVPKTARSHRSVDTQLKSEYSGCSEQYQPIVNAMLTGDEATVTTLLRATTPIVLEARNRDDDNLLTMSLKHKPHNRRITQALLDAKADPNTKCGGCYALHLSVGLNDPSLVRLLLKAKANPMLTDDAGMTPLQLLTRGRNFHNSPAARAGIITALEKEMKRSKETAVTNDHQAAAAMVNEAVAVVESISSSISISSSLSSSTSSITTAAAAAATINSNNTDDATVSTVPAPEPDFSVIKRSFISTLLPSLTIAFKSTSGSAAAAIKKQILQNIQTLIESISVDFYPKSADWISNFAEFLSFMARGGAEVAALPTVLSIIQLLLDKDKNKDFVVALDRHGVGAELELLAKSNSRKTNRAISTAAQDIITRHFQAMNKKTTSRTTMTTTASTTSTSTISPSSPSASSSQQQQHQLIAKLESLGKALSKKSSASDDESGFSFAVSVLVEILSMTPGTTTTTTTTATSVVPAEDSSPKKDDEGVPPAALSATLHEYLQARVFSALATFLSGLGILSQERAVDAFLAAAAKVTNDQRLNVFNLLVSATKSAIDSVERLPLRIFDTGKFTALNRSIQISVSRRAGETGLGDLGEMDITTEPLIMGKELKQHIHKALMAQRPSSNSNNSNNSSSTVAIHNNNNTNNNNNNTGGGASGRVALEAMLPELMGFLDPTILAALGIRNPRDEDDDDEDDDIEDDDDDDDGEPRADHRLQQQLWAMLSDRQSSASIDINVVGGSSLLFTIRSTRGNLARSYSALPPRNRWGEERRSADDDESVFTRDRRELPVRIDGAAGGSNEEGKSENSKDGEGDIVLELVGSSPLKASKAVVGHKRGPAAMTNDNAAAAQQQQQQQQQQRRYVIRDDQTLIQAVYEMLQDYRAAFWNMKFAVEYRSNTVRPEDKQQQQQQSESESQEASHPWTIDQLPSVATSSVLDYLQKSASGNFLRRWGLHPSGYRGQRIKGKLNEKQIDTIHRAYGDWIASAKTSAKRSLKLGASNHDSAFGTTTAAAAGGSSSSSNVINNNNNNNNVHPIRELIERKFPALSSQRCAEPLLLLQILAKINKSRRLGLEPQLFEDKSVCSKLKTQMSDALSMAASLQADWCIQIMKQARALVPFYLRNLYFRATALGVSRSLESVQNLICLMNVSQASASSSSPIVVAALSSSMTVSMSAAAASSSSSSSSRRRSGGGGSAASSIDRTIPTLDNEFVRVDRETLMVWADAVLAAHAPRKTQLQVLFRSNGVDENGVGPGVTKEFFADVAAEIATFQPVKGVDVWRCVNSQEGLFFAPLKLTKSEDVAALLRYCRFIGRFVAKSLQQQHTPGLHVHKRLWSLVMGKPVKSLQHLSQIDPQTAQSIKVLMEKAQLYENLSSQNRDESAVKTLENEIENMGLFFETPQGVPLCDGGSDIAVTADNLMRYTSLYLVYVLQTEMNLDIEQQVAAMIQGINDVFPLQHLHVFTSAELQSFLFNEVEWSEEDLKRFVVLERNVGLNGDRMVGWLRTFLFEMPQAERRSFLKFTTGSPCLPKGGLCALVGHDGRVGLKVSLREDAMGDLALVSCNTCVHNIKLPIYSSYEVLTRQITISVSESSHLMDFN